MQSRNKRYRISEEQVDQDDKVDQDQEPGRKKSPGLRNAASLTPSSESEEDDQHNDILEEEDKSKFSVRKARPSIRIL
jgi:hypothetical protein